MKFFSLRKWLQRPSRSARRTPAASRPSFGKLHLEALEPRLAPATDIWTGGAGAGNRNWGTAANWGNGVPNPGDDLVFPAGVPAASLSTINNLTVGTAFNSISISSSNYALSGNRIILGSPAGGGSVNVSGSSTADSISFDIQMGGAAGNRQFFTVNFAADLTITGKFSGTTGVELTKEGGGLLVLRSDNSAFTGPITVDQGILQISNAKALGDTTGDTTVLTNAQLQVASGTGIISESLRLNGSGISNNGALLNVSGNNTWAGPVELDSDSAVGASASSSLNITGQVSDTGAGHNLSKEGLGQVILSNANVYRGLTTVDNGILTIRNAAALGTADDTMTTGTLVNSNASASGTLQIEDPTGVGFTVVNERFTLNGPGFNPGTGSIGALDNLNGDNTWTGDVTLGSLAPNGSDVSIGSEDQGNRVTNLLISGVVDNINGTYNFTKVGPGRVIFAASDTYRGLTTVANGYLQIRDSQGLGQGSDPQNQGTVVNNGGSLELAVDGQPDSITGTTNTLRIPVNEVLTINGRGVVPPGSIEGVGGALHSVSGINIWQSPITLSVFNVPLPPTGGPTATSGVIAGSTDPATANSIPGVDAIGVDADPNPSANASYFTNDYSLTITGVIGDTTPPGSNDPNNFNPIWPILQGPSPQFIPWPATLAKVSTGQLILPVANTYTGATNIEAGWVTIQNNNALGGRLKAFDPGATNPYQPAGFPTKPLPDSLQPVVHVFSGAALHLRPLVPGQHIDLVKNLVLSGNGITHPFSQISGKGALMSLDGLNTVGGLAQGTPGYTGTFSTVQFDGNAGIGVQQLVPGDASELAVTAPTSDYVPRTPQLPPVTTGYPDPEGTGGDFTLLYSAPQNEPETSMVFDTGSTSGSIIYQYYSLDLPGIPDDFRIYSPPRGQAGSTLLFDSGSVFVGLTTVDLNFAGNTSHQIEIVVNEGAGSPAGDFWAYSVTMLGAAHSGGLTKWGTGRLDLQGAGSYTGSDFVNEGILRVQQDSALGSPNAATNVTVATGATLELAGGTALGNGGVNFAGVEVWNKTLILNGDGVAGEGALTSFDNDNLWRGPVTFDTSTTIDAEQNSRVTIFGAIDDKPNASPTGSDLTKVGLGTLALAGSNTYRGTTFVNIGVVNVQNSQGLGATTGSVIVANGASLELQGDITIAGKQLTIQGAGVATAPVLPVRWFAQGPAPIDNGQTPGNEPVAGRVTGVTVDPNDPQTIYVSAAGGGAWKTTDGGQTWLPLFDNQLNSTLFAGAIAIAPTDPKTVYLGTGEADNSADSYYGNGVYKSTDAGKSWTLLTNNGGLNPLNGKSVSKILVDPNNANLIYVATGDQATNDTLGVGTINSSAVSNPGIWRYDGTRWFNLTNVTSTNRNTVVGQAPFDAPPTGWGPPQVPGPDDEYRISFPQSNATWSDLGLLNLGGGVYYVYAALGTYTGAPFDYPDTPLPPLTYPQFPKTGITVNAVYRCDNPESFTPVWWIGATETPDARGSEFPNPLADAGRTTDNGNIKITVDPSGATPNIYAAISRPVDGRITDGQLYEIQFNNNGGFAAWNPTSATPPNYMGNMGWYDSTILTVDGTQVFVAGQNQILYTPDGGATWTDISMDAQGNGPHFDYHAMTLDSFYRLIVGNDGGVWRLDPTAAAFQWTDLNGNLAITQLNGVSTNPSNLTSAFGGSQGNGTEQFSNTQAWNQTDDMDGGLVRIDQNNPNNVYHIQDGTLRRSTTGGNAGSWVTVLNIGANANYPFFLDSVNTNRLLVGTDTSILESVDQGTTWANLNVTLPAPRRVVAVKAVAAAEFQGPFVFDPNFPLVTDKGANTYDPDTIYAIVTDDQGNDRVVMTKNHGQSWVVISAGLPGSLANITVDPRDRDNPYVVRGAFGGSGKVFMGSNVGSGIAWTNITGSGLGALPDTPAWSVLVDPRTNNLYVGTDKGVYLLPNGGSSWQSFGVGLPLTQAHDMVLNETLNTLAVGSYGRGMFQVLLADSQNSAGALRSISGAAVWTGPVILVGPTTISAGGTQLIKNGRINATLNIVGTISDAVAGTTTNTLTKIGGGDVILSGSNTYGGDTIINQGVLIVENPLALGDTGHGTFVDPTDPVNFPAALELQVSVALEPLSLMYDGVLFNGHYTGALRNISNNNAYTGPITLLTNATIGVDSGSQLTIGIATGLAGSGSIGDGGANLSLTKELTGTLVLNTANTYGGTTFVNQGALQVQHPQALGTTTNGTQVLDGAQLQLRTPLIGPLAGQPIVVSGEALKLSGTGIFGTGALLNVAGNNTWQGPITLASLPNFSPPTTPPNFVSFGVSVAGDTLTLDGPIGESAGSFGLTKVGPGKVVLTKVNTYSGVTTVQTGILSIQNPQALGTPGGPPNNGTVVASGGTLQLDLDPLNTGTPQTISGETLTLNGGGLGGIGALENLTGNNTWVAPMVLNTSSSIGVDGGLLTITGNIQGVAAATLSKVGTGTLIFTTANSYLGQTLITAGTLNLQAAGSLGGATGGGTTVSAGATLQLQNLNAPTPAAKTLQLRGTGFNNQGALDNFQGSNTWSGPVTLAAATAIAVDLPADVLVLSGVIGQINGVQSLTQLGVGTLAFQGAASNTYTGLTTVNDGTLLLSKTGGAVALQGNLTVGNGDTFPAVVQETVANQIADTAAVSVKSDGTFTLNNLADVIGPLTITDGTATTGPTGGTLTVSSLNMTGGNLMVPGAASTVVLQGAVIATSDSAGTATISGLGTLDLGGATRNFTVNAGAKSIDLTVSAIIVNGGLNKFGGGVMDVTAFNTYAGGTTVNAGKLLVDGTIGNVSLAGGTLGGVGTVGNIGSALAGGTVAPGDRPPVGTLHSGTVTWNANTTFNVELNGTGGNNDVLAATGPVALGTAQLTGTLGYEAAIGDSFVILTDSGAGANIGGAFAQGTSVFIPGPSAVRKFAIVIDNSAATKIVTLKRIQANTVTTITQAVPNPSTFGTAVTFTITVVPEAGATGVPTGTVNLMEGTTTLASGLTLTNVGGVATATYTTVPSTQLTGGTHLLYAVYSSDTDFTTSTSANFTQVVNKHVTTTTLSAGVPNPSTFGDMVTFTATVTPTIGTVLPTGTVDFKEGTTTLGTVNLTNVGGVATAVFTTSAEQLTGGTHLIFAVYNNDINFSGSTSNTVTQTVNKHVTVTNLVSTPNPSIFGTPVTFTATVTPKLGTVLPTGTVDFKEGTTVLASGVPLTNVGGVATAVFTTTDVQLSGGTHTIVAVYSSDGNFGASTSNTVSQVVQTHATTTTITTSFPTPSLYGQQVTFIAQVTPTIDGVLPTGTVDFKEGSTLLGSAPLVNAAGVATATFSTTPTELTISTHTIYAVYNGDGNFSVSPNSTSVTQVVNNPTTTTLVTSSVNPSVYGQVVTFKATVTTSFTSPLIPTGSVTFSIDNGPATPPITLDSNGQATFTPPTFLSVANHAVTVIYTPSGTLPVNGTYLGSTGMLTGGQTVNKASTTTSVSADNSPSTYGQIVTFTATVGPQFPSVATPTGTVSFVIDGATVISGVPLVGGQATYQTSTLSVLGSPHAVLVNYTNLDGSFNASSGTLPGGQTVLQANTTTTVTSSPNPSVFGEAVTFTATVAPVVPGGGTPVGTVTFSIDGTPQTPDVNLSGGVATLTISTLSVTGAPHVISVHYNGTSNYAASDGSLPSGQTVNPADTSTTVTSNLAKPVFGQPVTFTATVAAVLPGVGTPDGTVTFVIDSVPQSPDVTLVNGQASFTTSGLSVAGSPHTVAVDYNGGTSFNISSGLLPGGQTVLKANTTTTLAANPLAVVSGQPLTLTATLGVVAPGAGAPSGTVTFFVDGVPLSPAAAVVNGQASVTTKLTASGSPHVITATYNGDGSFNVSSGTQSPSPTVTPDGTTTVVLSNTTPSFFGQAVTFTATVTPLSPGSGTPTGNVTFTIDGIRQTPDEPVVNGTATFTTGTLSVGTHAVQGTYQGDGNFLTSQGAVTPNQVTIKSNTTTTVVSSGNPSSFGQLVTFTATVASPGIFTPDGTVTFLLDGAPQAPSVPLVNGRASFTTSALLASATGHNVQALYNGSVDFNGSTGTLSPLQVVAKPGTLLTVTTSNDTILYGQAVTFTATVTALAPGAGVPTGTLSFLFDGVTQPAAVALVNGQATYTTTTLTAVGSPHTIEGYYSGDANFLASLGTLNHQIVTADDTTLTLAAPGATPPAGKTLLFTATVATAPGFPPPVGTVTFSVDGTPLPPVALDVLDRARQGIALTAGNHTVVATFSSSGNFNASTATIVQAVYTPNQSYVYQLYRDLLGREADSFGLQVFSGALDAGASRASIVAAFLVSPEYLTRELNSIYLAYLGRPIDPLGLNTWLTVLENKTLYAADQDVVDFVRAQILGSPEYFAGHGGGSNAGFVTALYQDVLGRGPDPFGNASFNAMLAAGFSRSAVALAMLNSPESATDIVEAFYYSQYLHRAADAGGLASFVNALQTQHDEDPIVIGILASDEYFGNL